MKELIGQKILFISANLYPISAGDSLFSSKLVNELAISNALTVVSLSKEPFDLDENIVWNTVYERRLVWKHLLRLVYNQALAITGPVNFPRHLLREKWDVIIIDHLRSYGIVRRMLSNLSFNRLFYVAHNIEILNNKQKIYFEKNRTNKLKAHLNWGIRNRESEIIRRSNMVFALTENDEYVIRNLFYKENVGKVALKINPQNKPRNSTDILLIGSLKWYPNLIGVTDFLDCFEKHPELKNRVSIIGAGSENLSSRDNRVSILGFVENLEAQYARAGYLVVTNVYGTGIKMKIHDALEKGLIVLAIKEAALGYNQYELNNLLVFENIKGIMLFLQENNNLN